MSELREIEINREKFFRDRLEENDELELTEEQKANIEEDKKEFGEKFC